MNNNRCKCVNCSRIQKKGNDLFFCEYSGTYYSEVATYRPNRCDGFNDRGTYSMDDDADLLTTRCFHCGKPIIHGLNVIGKSIDDIYCDECKPIQTALDRKKIELSIQDEKTARELLKAVVSQAIRDYKLTLNSIIKTPFSTAKQTARRELEEYFFSNDFRNQVDFILDNDGHENSKDRFEFHVVKMLNTMRRECRYDPNKYDL